jgi:putative membrane protein
MKLRYESTILLATAIISPVLLFAQFPPSQSQQNPSQQNPSQQNPSQPQLPSTQDSASNSGDVGQVMQDKMFLRKAAEGGIAEVKLGQLAAQKASSDDVKAFAQKMVDDHTRLNEEIAQIADSMGVMLPKSINKEDQAEYDKLNALSGNDFDLEYLSFMVKDHHKDLHEFRIEAASHADPTLRDEVVKASAVIHEHTVMVDKLARAKGLTVPAHGGNKPTPTPAPSAGSSQPVQKRVPSGVICA